MPLPPEIQAILNEIEALLPSVSWARDLRKNAPHDAKFYVGEAGGWKIVITDFDISDQGFPPGSRGQDGAGNNLEKMLVMRLTRDLAAKAVQMAEAALKP